MTTTPPPEDTTEPHLRIDSGWARAHSGPCAPPPWPAAEDDAVDPEEASRPAWDAARARYPETGTAGGVDAFQRVAFTEGWSAALDAAGVSALREEVEAQKELVQAWYAAACAVRQHGEQAQQQVADLVDALRLTVEYVGTKMLPPIPGWSWFDALSKHAPQVAAALAEGGQGDVERHVMAGEPGAAWDYLSPAPVVPDSAGLREHRIVGVGHSTTHGVYVTCACTGDDTGYGDGTPIPADTYVSEHLAVVGQDVNAGQAEMVCRDCGHSMDEHSAIRGGRCLAPFTACTCAVVRSGEQDEGGAP